tara:strand:- start:312 stop:692 length:381 start_codon:yes stop_codon:yes gene_type:complete
MTTLTATPADRRTPSSQALLDRAYALETLSAGDDFVDIDIEVREEDATDLIRVRVESAFSPPDDEESWSSAQAAIVSQWNGETGIFDVKTRTWGVKTTKTSSAWEKPTALLEQVRALVDSILCEAH